MEATAETDFSQLVAMFLSEILRSRRTSLSRAAEISRRVLGMIPKIKSEGDTLKALTEIEQEFIEVSSLKQALNFGYHHSDIKVYEKEIKEYASKIFLKDMEQSSVFLQDAARPGMVIQELCVKYPEFCHFLLNATDKGELLPELKEA